MLFWPTIPEKKAQKPMISPSRLLNNQSLYGILLGLAAFTVWACGDAITKFVGKAEVPVAQIITISGLGAFLIFTISALARGNLGRIRPRNMKLHAAQALLLTILPVVNVVTFTQLPLTTVYTALFSAPLLISILGYVFLKEPLGRLQLLYIVIGFIGSLIAVNPLEADLSGGNALGWMLLGVYPLLFSANTLLMRVQCKNAPVESVVTFPLAFRTLFFLPIALWDWQPMGFAETLGVCCIGMTFGCGLLLFSTALSKASSTTVSPLHYSQLVIGAALGYIFWQDVPATHTIVGSVIIVAAGLAGARLASLNNGEVEALPRQGQDEVFEAA